MPSSPRSAPHGDRGAARLRLLAAALAVSIAAFLLYRATLLPGVDLGDSASFQTMVGSPYITPRDGYPLYFAIGAAVLRLTGAEPAHALNLTSALEAAAACGLFVVVATMLTGSLGAATAGAILFGVSYTFWSQSVTAEVYALHMAFVLASLFFLLRWAERPTPGRLAAFFACYAIGFGNHLSMILLAPGFTIFLMLTAPRGWRSLVEPRVLALAAGLACMGALQYTWNLRTLWYLPEPPHSLAEALRVFWFDVTKADWRETLVGQVPPSMRADHSAMYWFDVRQQFGLAGELLAVVGLVFLAATRPRAAVLLALLFAANFLFAFGYNVGDTHVFYLPSHLIVALAASAGIAALAAVPGLPRAGRTIVVVLAAAYAIARGYHDFPALDRSGDRRASRMLASLTADLDDRRAILLVDLNWQIANGLSYFTGAVRPEVATARMQDVLPYAPRLVRDNLASGRSVAMTERAHALFVDAHGATFEAVADFGTTPSRTLAEIVGAIAPGTRYALCILKPTKDFTLDRRDLESAAHILSPSAAVAIPPEDYSVIAGVSGRAPTLIAASSLPFARRVDVDGVPVEVRMDSWLSADTIRRMGFGHVVAAHRHSLIVERGVSFVTFGSDGTALSVEYLAGIFAPAARYLIRTDVVR